MDGRTSERASDDIWFRYGPFYNIADITRHTHKHTSTHTNTHTDTNANIRFGIPLCRFFLNASLIPWLRLQQQPLPLPRPPQPSSTLMTSVAMATSTTQANAVDAHARRGGYRSTGSPTRNFAETHTAHEERSRSGRPDDGDDDDGDGSQTTTVSGVGGVRGGSDHRQRVTRKTTSTSCVISGAYISHAKS